MDPEAALDAVFVQTMPDLQFRTCGPTFKPSTCYNRGEHVIWNCEPNIPGTAAPRPGLSGLLDQMALLCPSTTYILLPSQPINELCSDDIELLLDVADTLNQIHETMNVDMYVILIFKDVAPTVCQQYAHLFQADFALQGYVGRLIYLSLLHDLDTPEYHRRSTHFYRYPGLDTRTQVLSPVPRCSNLLEQFVPAQLDPASPLKVAWKGSIFSSANEEYTGFRFLHSCNVGMPVGPVRFSSCIPPEKAQSTLTRTRANFVITLDITSCDKTIELIESWRTLHMEVFLEYDEKLFIASWVPPRGYINHWHITACSVQPSSPDIPPKVGLMLPNGLQMQSRNQAPALTVLPSADVDVPILSLSDIYKMSKKGKKTQSVLFGQTRRFKIITQDPATVGATTNFRNVNRSKKVTMQEDIIGIDDALVGKKMQASLGTKGSVVRPLSVVESTVPTKDVSRNFRVKLQLKSKLLTTIRRDRRNATKSQFRQKLASKVDPRLVKVAMRQYINNLGRSPSRATAQDSIHKSKKYPRSWSCLGRIASDFDEWDFPKSKTPPTGGLSSSCHGIDCQDKDARAEVETAVFVSGIEFASAPIKPERMCQVLRGLNELRSTSLASV